ncbi:MAG: hypothetical protein ACJAQT_001528 [Akkermansiaceae bacterium]|jgi:hypothetical protein
MKFLNLFGVLLGTLTPLAHAEQVVFSEVMYHPPVSGHEFVEVQNLTATPFDIALWELSNGADFTFPDFGAGAPLDTFLKAFERIILCDTDPATFRATYNVPTTIRVFGPWTGQLANGGERITLSDKNGVAMCSMSYDDRHPWPVAADGAGHSLVLADTSYAIDDYRVWTSAPPTPGFSPTLVAEEPFPNPEVNLSVGIPFVNYSDTWAFNDQNLDLGATWKETVYAFTHAGWTLENDAGNNGGLYGFESSSVPAPGMQTPLLNSSNEANHITYYFRREFTYNGPTTGANVTIDMINDDSAYFYLNGTPIGGLGTTANAGWKTRATRTVTNATEELAVATNNGSALVAGTNVICAEVHQVNDGSSDSVFGSRLSISAPSSPSILINEVLPATEGFVEFYNPGGSSIDLAGWFLTDDPGNLTKYPIPAGVIVPASGLASISYGDAGLGTTGDTVLYLTETDGSTIANAIDTTMPLDGRSLGRKGDGSSSWFLFSEPSENAPNASSSGNLSLKINETAFDQNGNTLWIELFNPSSVALDTTGLFLASLPNFSDKVALSGSVSGLGHLSITESFSTNGGELTLFLVNGSNTVIEAVAINHASPRNFSAAFPDGSGIFYASGSSSQGSSNSPDRETGIVISELMVDPPTEHRDGEFIELFNKSASSIDLSGWSFADGVNFDFPDGTTLGSGQYLVIAANENFTNYPSLIGQYEGVLANGGELLQLVDSWGNLADEVHYHTGGHWPSLAGGQGSSLELQHPNMDNSQPSAWADSDESQKSSFASYTLTEQFENITTRGSASDYEELHLQAVGDTHLAFKNISLTRNGGSNILPGGGNSVVTNGNGASGWLCQGTHYTSAIVNGEFHLISNGHGDVKANRCEIDVTQIRDNDTLTFSFEARWVSGKPTFIVETWDRSFGGVFHLPVPKNLGTPGASNSASLASPIPTVSGLIHSPPVPRTSDPVRITAKVTDATSVTLKHRLDTSGGNGSWNSAPMFDDGTSGGDEVANDGIFSATLTNYQSDNAIVQFYVEASSAGGLSQQPRLAPERPAMWVVDNTAHATDLRRQRFIISARDQSASGGTGDSATFNYSFPRLSNNYFNATFISDDKDIIYNCEMRKSGSPWTRSSGTDFSRMKWKPPSDRKFRGYAKRAVDNDAGGSKAYHNRIIRYWLYLFGHAANENEFVRVIINGGSASIREDVEPNSTDFLKRNWKDGQKGELYRIDDQWWFDDGWGRSQQNATWDYKNTTEPERYSSEWIKRSREAEHDYSSFIAWTKMVDTNSFTREEMERTADIDLMAANAVVRGWCDDWDTLTRNRGKNGYFLRRATDGKWMLIQWDSDLTFGNSNAAFIGNLTGVQNFFGKPYVKQRVNHYLSEMVNKYTANSARLDAWFQCEEDASNSYPSNQSTYTNWNNARISTANSTMGSALNTNFNVTSGNGSSLSTSSDVISLQGASGADTFEIRAVGQPQATYRFSSTTGWTLTGIQLQQGANSIVVEAVDQAGLVVGSETFTVTKTGNALPVVVLDADPKTFNIPVGNPFQIDASTSFDPEGTTLTYTWQIAGFGGISNPTPDSAEMTFTTPGHYDLTLTVTDSNSQQTIITRQIVAYANSGWDPFNQAVLGSVWTPENLAVRDGAAPPSSYSLDDTPNKLALKVEEDFAKPLVLSSPTHPMLWRNTPSDDWSFATDLTLTSVQQGNFYTGIIVDTVQSGSPVRFTLGMEDGDFLRVKRITSGSVTTLATLNWSEKDAVIRVRKSNTRLTFQYREEPGLWVDLHLQNYATGSTTTSQAGLFAATDIPQALRVEFDDALLVDPNVSSPTLDSLRITELMYNPLGGGSTEFIEVLNTSFSPLMLAGASFNDTKPFGAFSFTSVTLAPGQYAVLVADEIAFRNRYGDTPVIIGQWSNGALSNSGENVELLDPFNNLIHDFSYDDIAPWPLAADGDGPSLEIINTEGDYNDPLNWRASAFTDGSPGLPFATDQDGDGLSNIQESALGTNDALADTDSDGASDFDEVAAGTDPLDPASLFRILRVGPTAVPDQIEIIWTSVPGRTYIVESSRTLEGTWNLHASVTATGLTSAAVDATSVDLKFYRIRITSQ